MIFSARRHLRRTPLAIALILYGVVSAAPAIAVPTLLSQDSVARVTETGEGACDPPSAQICSALVTGPFSQTSEQTSTSVGPFAGTVSNPGASARLVVFATPERIEVDGDMAATGYYDIVHFPGGGGVDYGVSAGTTAESTLTATFRVDEPTDFTLGVDLTVYSYFAASSVYVRLSGPNGMLHEITCPTVLGLYCGPQHTDDAGTLAPGIYMLEVFASANGDEIVLEDPPPSEGSADFHVSLQFPQPLPYLGIPSSVTMTTLLLASGTLALVRQRRGCGIRPGSRGGGQ